MAAMMTLGLFTFHLPTLVFQDLQRRTAWRHGQTPRVGARPANQFLGPESDTLTLSGMVAPGIIGRLAALQELRDMGDQGSAWPLVTGSGEVLGAWVIDAVDEGHQIILDNGMPRRADFTIQLRRVDDQDATAPNARPPGGDPLV